MAMKVCCRLLCCLAWLLSATGVCAQKPLPTVYGTSAEARAAAVEETVARQWNEVLLEAIRGDFARPTVHARNLFHSSVLAFDAFAAYDTVDAPLFLGQDWQGTVIPFDAGALNVPMTDSARTAAQETAISHAMYRLLSHRFASSPGHEESQTRFDDLMLALGCDVSNVGVDYAQGPAELGNHLAEQMIAFGSGDGANEAADYANSVYEAVNPDLELAAPGNDALIDPNAWQPLAIPVFVDQSGNVLSETPDFQGAEWGQVAPFALSDSVRQDYERDGNTWPVYLDCGAPPLFQEGALVGEAADAHAWGFALVALWSGHLDQEDTTVWDISPASVGNLPVTGPPSFEEMDSFYDWIDGGDVAPGHSENPSTGEPYAENPVLRGDYTRVLAEFWADGPESETPPGHWFVLLNGAMDHPDFSTHWKGQGAALDPLRYTVRAYLTLGGALHDAAIAAWSHKGYYDYIRPVSAIRYMAGLGQRSDSTLVSYHPGGLPLVPGHIELVEAGDPLAGFAGIHVGKVKVRAWQGPDAIISPIWDEAGVDWILAENWWPYQRPSFVTPPFAGYVSGHSTFSRAAAEILTAITGDPFFPGGMGVFPVTQNQFLVFEDGPSMSFDLQWATYRDASDQCSLSRIWGGIHPPADDFPGRQLGVQVAAIALERAEMQFGEVEGVTLECPADLSLDGVIGAADILLALASFGVTGVDLPGDLDDNGTVGVDDVLSLLAAYGEPCPLN